MLSEKDQHFIRTLLQATSTRRLVWQESSTVECYATTFLGKYDVALEKQADGCRLRMTDHLQRELLSVRSTDYVGIGELFEAVRRALYNVDEAIDEIIENINHPRQELGTGSHRFRAHRGAPVSTAGLHRMHAA